MKITAITLGCAFVLSLGGCGGGTDSKECKAYFAKVEECAKKAPEIKANAIKEAAKVSKENFEKNSNPAAVSKSCEMMLESLNNDPDCK